MRKISNNTNNISLSSYANILKLVPEKNTNAVYLEKMIQQIKSKSYTDKVGYGTNK